MSKLTPKQPGTRVTITLKGVPEEASKVDPTHPLALFGLLQHEHKVSVLNFSVQRNTEYEAPVRSKAGFSLNKSSYLEFNAAIGSF